MIHGRWERFALIFSGACMGVMVTIAANMVIFSVRHGTQNVYGWTALGLMSVAADEGTTFAVQREPPAREPLRVS